MAAPVDLPGTVRRAFEPGRFAGTLRIRHGRGPLARLVAILARFPEESDEARVVLTIEESPGGTRWIRRFPDRELVTIQRVLQGGRIAERLGLVECRLDVRVEDGAARLLPAGAALALGTMRLPLPGPLAPRVSARLLPRGSRFEVQVAIELALAGLVLAYDGVVAQESA